MRALLVVFVVLPQAIHASPTSQGYEDRLIAWGVKSVDGTLEPQPEGKRIEEILVASENVFDPADPLPMFLNVFHWKTKEAVIRREVLQGVGDVWSQARAQETERILRRMSIIAVARVVALQGKQGGVALLVVTKDRWSLRLNNNFTLIGSLLQFLQLQLVEINFRGLAQQLSLDMVLRLDTLALGQTFIERRLFGSQLYFGETASIVLNRQTGIPEGTSGAVEFSQPLRSLSQQWSFVAQGDWNVRRRRVFRGASIWQLPYVDGTSTVPLVYDVADISSEASVTRSFGQAVKTDVTLALGGYFRRYTPAASSNLTAEQAAWLVTNWLPRTETATYAALTARWFPANFQVLRDIDAFELSEDFQIGPLLQGGVRWAFPTPLAATHYVEVGGAFRYRLYAGDDLLTFSTAGFARMRPGASTVNERVTAEVINYSPRFYGGRFVTRVLADFRWNDLDNRQILLGGSTGLRGAFAEQFTGRNQVLANVEYRTKPFEIVSVFLGLVLFYDVGSAFNDVPVLTHSMGVGLRLLLPQFNQQVIRIDFGVVLGGAQPGLDRLNATFGQVTDLRPFFLDDPLGYGTR